MNDDVPLGNEFQSIFVSSLYRLTLGKGISDQFQPSISDACALFSLLVIFLIQGMDTIGKKKSNSLEA